MTQEIPIRDYINEKKTCGLWWKQTVSIGAWSEPKGGRVQWGENEFEPGGNAERLL